MLGTSKYITLEAAKQMAAAGEAEARKNGWNVAIAVVDISGGLILFHKLDETQAGSIVVAQGKARAGALVKRPSKGRELRVNRTHEVPYVRVASFAGGPLVARGAEPYAGPGTAHRFSGPAASRRHSLFRPRGGGVYQACQGWVAIAAAQRPRGTCGR